jgi:hypothetical protein
MSQRLQDDFEMLQILLTEEDDNADEDELELLAAVGGVLVVFGAEESHRLCSE